MSLLRSFLVFPATTLLFACGGAVADAPATGAQHDVAPSEMSGGSATGDKTGSGDTTNTGGAVIGPPTVIGQLYALTELGGDQHVYQRFDFDFRAQGDPEGMCDRATATVGSCCSFPPIMRPPTQPPGQGTPTPSPEESAGTLTFSDVTTSSTIGTFDYHGAIYSHAPGSYESQVWRPGDELRVTAAGGAEVGAFTVSAPSLLLPDPHAPAEITQGQDVAVTWQPDANADKLIISILDGGSGASVACSVPDSAGAVTVSGSLLAMFAPSTRLQGVAERSAVRYAQTTAGRVAFNNAGWTMFDLTVK